MLNLSNWWYGVNKLKQSLQIESKPLRIGVLSAAAINYAAIIDPVSTHPGAVLVAIGARSKAKAQAQIDKHGLGATCKACGSYDEVLQDEGVDAVYIPLPNGLHAAWAIKAMRAGKHVLVEKSIAANAEECRQVHRVSDETGKICLEAFHYRFHPAVHHVKHLIESGKYGNPTNVFARLVVMSNAFNDDDIRWQYDLGGGACLDLCYVFSAACYFGCVGDLSKANVNVQIAEPRVHKNDARIDEAIDATFTIEQSGTPPVKCHVQGDLDLPPLWGFIPRFLPEMPTLKIELEKARIDMTNFVVPTFGHKIVITEKDAQGRLTSTKKTEKVYVDGPMWKSRGQPWWTTYRYQLEAFVEAVRNKDSGREFEGPWYSLNDSQKVMEVIDKTYERMGMPVRGAVV